jgi:hypothetical protein
MDIYSRLGGLQDCGVPSPQPLPQGSEGAENSFLCSIPRWREGAENVSVWERLPSLFAHSFWNGDTVDSANPCVSIYTDVYA